MADEPERMVKRIISSHNQFWSYGKYITVWISVVDISDGMTDVHVGAHPVLVHQLLLVPASTYIMGDDWCSSHS